MKKMKKTVAVALSTTMVLALFAGCNKTKISTEPVSTEPAAFVEEVTVPELDGYTLLWNDEFSGDAMDESIWSYDPH